MFALLCYRDGSLLLETSLLFSSWRWPVFNLIDRDSPWLAPGNIGISGNGFGGFCRSRLSALANQRKGRSCDQTWGALPGCPHVLQADEEIRAVEAVVLGPGVFGVHVLTQKLRERERERERESESERERHRERWRNRPGGRKKERKKDKERERGDGGGRELLVSSLSLSRCSSTF